MAQFHTSITGEETHGEKTLYYTFCDKLSDEYHVWHNFVNLHTSLEHDFIIFHPVNGLFIIEVKDWKINQISDVNDKTLMLKTGQDVKKVKNPYYQALKCTYDIRNYLSKNPLLIHQGEKHSGKLILPVNYGVAFTNITQQQIIEKGISKFFPLMQTLDEFMCSGSGLTATDFTRALTELRTIRFEFTLNQNQFNEIMAYLGTPVVTDPASNEIIGVLDTNQDNLVKFKIYKQILIEGPAGSGKSLVLINRAIYMHERFPDWKIGIFCFNAVMSNFLKTLLCSEGFSSGITVNYFDGFDAWYRESGTFDAILIDEGQDAKERHLLNVIKLLNPETASFTMFYDPYQSIYQSSAIDELLLKTGFNIENTKSLVHQQRSISIIVALAFHKAMNRAGGEFSHIISDVLGISERYFNGYDNPISSISFGVSRHFENHIHQYENINLAELAKKHFHIFNFDTIPNMLEDFFPKIKFLVELGLASYNDFLVIYPNRYIGDYKHELYYPLRKGFKKFSIPFRIIDNKRRKGLSANFPDFEFVSEDDNRCSADLNENVVKAMTIHQSKGLDAKYVAILCFDEVIPKKGYQEDEINTIASLGYVALTRATNACFVYYIKENTAVYNLKAIIEELSER